MSLPTVKGLDLVKVEELIERHLARNTKVVDRSTQLAVSPESRAHSRKQGGDGAWAHRAMPSDPPVIQMIQYLAEQLESGPWTKIEDDYKRCQTQNQISKQITDLLSALEEKASSSFDELCTLVNQQMRASEHADKMSVASGKADTDLSDDQIKAKAKRLGITLNGDTP